MAFDLDAWLKAEIRDYVDMPSGPLTMEVVTDQWADIGRQLHARATSLELVKAITNAMLVWDAQHGHPQKTLQVHLAERLRIYLFTGVKR